MRFSYILIYVLVLCSTINVTYSKGGRGGGGGRGFGGSRGRSGGGSRGSSGGISSVFSFGKSSPSVHHSHVNNPVHAYPSSSGLSGGGFGSHGYPKSPGLSGNTIKINKPVYPSSFGLSGAGAPGYPKNFGSSSNTHQISYHVPSSGYGFNQAPPIIHGRVYSPVYPIHSGSTSNDLLTGLAVWNLARSHNHNNVHVYHHGNSYSNPTSFGGRNHETRNHPSDVCELIVLHPDKVRNVTTIPCEIVSSFESNLPKDLDLTNFPTNDEYKCTISIKKSGRYRTTDVPCDFLHKQASEGKNKNINMELFPAPDLGIVPLKSNT